MRFNVTSKQDVKSDKEKDFQSLPQNWINVGINTSTKAENLKQSKLKWRLHVYYLKSVKICGCSVIPWWLSEMILLWKDLLVPWKWNWPREAIGIRRSSVQSQCGSSKQNHCLWTQARCQRYFRLQHAQSRALAQKSQHHMGPDTGATLVAERCEGLAGYWKRSSTAARFLHSSRYPIQAVKFSNPPHAVCIIGNIYFTEWL